MNGSRITDSPIGAVLLIIGSVIAVMALVCVIIQIYKNHISDRSMCREIYGTDKPGIRYTLQSSPPRKKR